MKTQLKLGPRDAGRPVTWADLESADLDEGFRYELVGGILTVSPAPNLSHEELVGWLVNVLREFGATHPGFYDKILGPARVFVPDIEEGVTAPEPDLACFRDYPHHLRISERSWNDLTPVLVAEVVSPDNADKDLDRNVDLYRRVASIREYWILDTRASIDFPSMIAYRRGGNRRWLAPVVTAPGGIYTTAFLPGLELRVKPV